MGGKFILPPTWFSFYRTDTITSVKVGEVATFPEDLKEKLDAFQSHVWGAASGKTRKLDHLEMTVSAGKDEGFIIDRLFREKRCGNVEQLDETHWRFTADVYDALELLPWIRTYTGRITDLRCSNPNVLKRFNDDLEAMATLYGGETDAVS